MASKNIEALVVEYLKDLKIPPDIKDATTDLVQKMMSHECYGNPKYKWSLDDFELGKRLGRGKFGRVFVAREKKTGFIVAIKTLLKKELKLNGVEKQVLQEIEIQSHLKHPNILQLLCWFHDYHRIYLVVEYCGGGELYKHLKSSPHGRFNEHLAAKYTSQVAAALNYCHENQVIHRDIKPENLLLTFDDNIKLADFGWSVHSPSLTRHTMCGTIDYLPPEMIEHEPYGKYVDHWCVGILCYEFLVGNPPFAGKDTNEMYQKITAIDLKYPEWVSEDAKDLISKLVMRPGPSRLELPKVMEHPWIVANQ